MNQSRVPNYDDSKATGMRAWFRAMARQGLLFHPDDAPAEIIVIRTGQRMFSEEECRKAEVILNAMFGRFGDKVYEAAYPVFMAAFAAMIKR